MHFVVIFTPLNKLFEFLLVFPEKKTNWTCGIWAVERAIFWFEMRARLEIQGIAHYIAAHDHNIRPVACVLVSFVFQAFLISWVRVCCFLYINKTLLHLFHNHWSEEEDELIYWIKAWNHRKHEQSMLVIDLTRMYVA